MREEEEVWPSTTQMDALFLPTPEVLETVTASAGRNTK